jgi:hypothetical protein
MLGASKDPVEQIYTYQHINAYNLVVSTHKGIVTWKI